ncbi:MAG: hypothetical protein CME64_05410 [Halobacteriovoraceae bacterium]|nr:hypothetical protein [Halobacteriovoraceae bacterium]|tara:strand:+ start:258431 stop:258907 length:477 start_codon:yes stop_codon:yes gene_type:complete
MKIPFHRRKFLINTDFQFPFIARMVVVNLLTMAILFIGLYLIFYRFNFLGNELGFEADHRFYEFVREQFVIISALFLGAALSSSLVLAVYAVFLSHRIAGPLENLKIRFKQLKANAPKNCKTCFRKDDFFHDLASAYNDHLDNVQKLHDKARIDESSD